MRKSLDSKDIYINEEVSLTIRPLYTAKIFEIEIAEAEEYGEAPIQILESQQYEYEFLFKEHEYNNKYQLSGRGCTPSKSKTSSRGIIAPGNYVGTLGLDVLVNGKKESNCYLEVLATKFDATEDYDKSYRENYRSMVEDITDKCTELLMQSNSPINQYFEPDFDNKNEVLYQKFSFVKSILNKEEFEEAILKIFTSPKTKWINKEEKVDVRSIKRFTNKNVQELLRGRNRIPLPEGHSLYKKEKLENIPSKIINFKQEPSLDNHENRFIKHALEVYMQFCESCSAVFKLDSKDQKEAVFLVHKLERLLNHSFFKEISRPTTLKLNSPTLQRKSGYREVLKSWLMFDLASKLTWTGGEDVYNAGKRDIATLYEYWLFFVLYDLFKGKFNLTDLSHEGKPYSHLFETTKKGINLIIKAGEHTALEGSSVIKNRALNIKFSFNRTFSGTKDSYPDAGSWTASMRPDYTLTVWPQELNETEAERQELIVHIHFDAKYKVSHFAIKSTTKDEALSKEREREELDKLKEEERAGTFKNADLLKMHAYKDAIRRTGGAYVLYPGTIKSKFRGFHELIPGLGAFALNPGDQKAGVSALSSFIDKVILHLVDRASHRENIAIKTYKITKDGESDSLYEPIPEYINGEKLIPEETYVLVGYYKSAAHLDWIEKTGLYNFRMDSNRGALKLTKKTLSAKFLLLHGKGDQNSSKLYQIKKTEYRVTAKATLKRLDYPRPSQKSYLVVGVVKDESDEFRGIYWNFKELTNYKKGRASAIPFTASLSELLKHKVVLNENN